MRKKSNTFIYVAILVIFVSSLLLIYPQTPVKLIGQPDTQKDNSDDTLAAQITAREIGVGDCSGGAAFNPFSGSADLRECRVLSKVTLNTEVEKEKLEVVKDSFARGYLPTTEKVQSLMAEFNRGDILAAANIINYQARCVLWRQPGNIDAVYPCELLAANYQKAQAHLDVMVENRHPDALLGLALTKASPILQPDNADALQIEALMDKAIEAGSGQAAAMRDNAQKISRDRQQ